MRVRSRFLMALLLLVTACGGARTEPPPSAALPPLPPAATAPSSSERPAAAVEPESDCRAPWNGPAKDPKLSPKPGPGGLQSSPGRLASSDPVEVAYATARGDFEVQRWDRAATGFRAIAFGSPENDTAIYAAQLYLESINILREQAGRTSCEADMARDVPRLISLFCTKKRRSENEDACKVFDAIDADLRRRAGH